MNREPIETACDADLRCSKAAMQRAARRAREVAAQTGTCIVVGHDGIVEQIPQAPKQRDPDPDAPASERGNKR